MRPASLAVISLVSAVLGAGAALAIAKGSGWFGGTKTVVAESTSSVPAGARLPRIQPLLGARFDPARIYSERSPGVVTIYASFGDGASSQGSGFVVSPAGYVLTSSHV